MAGTTLHSNTRSTLSFPGLDERELRALSAHATVQTFPKSSVIINEGDRSDSIFIIRSGRVKVFLQNEDGKEVTLNIHGPGEYFGDSRTSLRAVTSA